MADKILKVDNLRISFKTDSGIVKAVRGVSFDLEKGETLCIVGESGSGKSVTSKAIMGILPSNSIIEDGSIFYEGENLLEVSEEEFYKIRGNKIGMVFQDPLSSLNPIVRIGKQITEATLVNNNKLKKMYDDLISFDLIAYKNTIARSDKKIQNEQNLFENKINEITKKLDNKSLTNEEKTELKNKVKELKKEHKEIVSKIKNETKIQASPLKIKLDKTKKEAKAKVEDYKRNITNEHKEKTKEISLQINDVKSKIEVIKNNINQLNKSFALEHSISISKIKQFLESNETNIINSYKTEVENLNSQLNILNESLNQIKKAKVYEKTAYIDKLKITKKEAKKRALQIMAEVGIPLPEKRFKQYPFEFSGGMRQRIVIAIALTAAPEILICDEPTTALDVTIQAQILELIKRIQKERNIGVVFITHDLGVVANMADRVAVMYAGKIVEYGNVDEVFFNPKHPYTWALLSSIPDVDSKERLEAIPGTPPNMIYPPVGDAFAARSKYAMKIDFEHEPPFFKVSDTHYAATWLLHPEAPKVEMPKIVSSRIKNALKSNQNGNNKKNILDKEAS